MDTFEKIRALLAEQLDIDPAKITMDSDIMSDFEADSLDIVDMVMTLEDEFGIEVPDDAIENLRTVGDVVEVCGQPQGLITVCKKAPHPRRCTRRHCSGAFNMSSCGTAGHSVWRTALGGYNKMAKDNKKLVQAITSQEENFAQWYTDICVKAELVEYSSVKGFIILRPYGQAIWELIQKDMDARFKATGHENVAMPVLIPESLLQKEGELVNGFAPEVAWVTMGGSDKLEERLAVRPTSETMFCDHWSRVLHSYRELPMKYNQWCSVVRWEKTTRPFLRSREFWWQEGHTIHETAAEAEAETQQQLNCYADVCEQDLAIPVVKGRKTDKEKFAGAEATYTIEAMMKDGKALQSGTSHYFGDKFSKAYDVTFTGRDNQLHHPFQTSWGVSTRLVGAIIMTHGDDDGLILPPAVAPIQVVVVPIAAHKPGVSEKAAELAEKISKYARVKLDDSDNAPGWKFSQWEMKGVPLRLEIGPKDLEKNQCVLVRRDTREKIFVCLDELETAIPAQLEALRKDLYERALANREKRTWAATTMEEVKELAKANTGYIKTMWCGDLACEMKMKEEVGLSSRCMPFEQEHLSDVCPCCGKPASKMVYWGVAY